MSRYPQRKLSLFLRPPGPLSSPPRSNNHHISFCSGTGLFNTPFSNALLTFSTTNSSIFSCVSYYSISCQPSNSVLAPFGMTRRRLTVYVPICGSNITCGLSTSPGCTFGSSSYTSRPAENTLPEARAVTRAPSSMTGPRAVFTITTPSFICWNCGCDIMW